MKRFQFSLIFILVVATSISASTNNKWEAISNDLNVSPSEVSTEVGSGLSSEVSSESTSKVYKAKKQAQKEELYKSLREAKLTTPNEKSKRAAKAQQRASSKIRNVDAPTR